MCNIWTIYKYEMKKIIGKKLVGITALLCIVGIIISAFSGVIGTYYVEGEPIESNYTAFRKDKAYRKGLSGRCIDKELLKETVDGYAHIPTDEINYTLTKEYERFARPYSDIYNLIRSWTGMGLSAIQNWEVDEVALYKARMQRLESNWKSIPLTEVEKEFWRNKESEINIPLRYDYHEGYENILNCFITVGVLMLLFVAICLSGLFPDEHIRRTDQLILSSAAGKEPVYWAKLFAGVTISIVAAISMTLMTMGFNLGIYGTEGFGMPFQSCFSTYSYPITIGQACLIAYGILIVSSIIAAIFVMFISEVFRSGLVALAISTGLIILGNVIMIPTQYRAIAQIWDWSPMAYLSTWNIFDSRTITLFGQSFTSWQAVPFIYLLLSVVLSGLGKNIYRQYQITGR